MCKQMCKQAKVFGRQGYVKHRPTVPVARCSNTLWLVCVQLLVFSTVAAFIAIAIYGAVRSRDTGSLLWATLAGAAVGVVFSIRPLTAVVAAFVVYADLPRGMPVA